MPQDPKEPVPRPSFMFDMMKGDDAGQGFRRIELPKKEPAEPAAPAQESAASSPPIPSRHRALLLISIVLGQAALVVMHLCAVMDPVVTLTGIATVGMLLTFIVALKSRRLAGGLLLAALTWGSTAFMLIPRAEWRDLPARAKAQVERVLH